jgi:ABC-2 type transport system permease protein
MPKLVNNFFWINQLKKDFYIDFSYKISFFGQFIGVILTIVSFFFISEIFSGSNSVHLNMYENDYFTFAIIGIAVFDMIVSIMRSLSNSVREAQTLGYVEILFVSRIDPAYFYLTSITYPFIKGLIKFIIYIALLGFMGDSVFKLSSIFLSLFFFSVMIIPFIGFSFISISFILFFKQSDPINFFINTFVSIFSGIVYPVSVLPSFMQNLSIFMPLTTQLNSLRYLLINNAFDDYIFSNLFYLHFLFSIFFLIISIKAFKITISLVIKKGSLGSY